MINNIFNYIKFLLELYFLFFEKYFVLLKFLLDFFFDFIKKNFSKVLFSIFKYNLVFNLIKKLIIILFIKYFFFKLKIIER